MTTPSLPFVPLFVLTAETCLSTKAATMRCSEIPDGICVFGRAKMIFLPGKHSFPLGCPVGVSGQPSLSVSLNPLSHHFMLFRLFQKCSFTDIRCLGSWLGGFLPSQGNFTEIAVPEVMWYKLKYLAKWFPCNRLDNEIQMCICNVCKQSLENSPGDPLKTVHTGNGQVIAIARGIMNVCCYICPWVCWLPRTPPRKR